MRRPILSRSVLIPAGVAVLALAFGAPGRAHDPQREATAPPHGSPSPAIALPAGWVESPPPAAPKALAPALVADGDGFLATWIEPSTSNAPDAGGGSRVRLARWHDGAWGAAATVRASPTLFANWADVPGVVRGADRALYVWWLERSVAAGEAYDAELARSSDEGATFHALGRLHEDRSAVEHGFVSAVAEGPNVRFYFLDGRATATGGPTELRSVLVAGERIGASAVVDDRVCDCCATAAVALAGGSAVAYRDRTAAEIRDIRIATRAASGAVATRAVADDAWKIAGCPVNGPALAAAGPKMAVAWYSAPGDRGRMAIAESTDSGSTWGAPQPLAAAKPIGHLALAPFAGGFAIAWLESATGDRGDRTDLRLAYSGADGKVGPAQAMASMVARRAAGFPRLASTATRLALLWVDPAAGLRFASAPVPSTH